MLEIALIIEYPCDSSFKVKDYSIVHLDNDMNIVLDYSLRDWSVI